MRASIGVVAPCMRPLLDQNLSLRRKDASRDLYRESKHVRDADFRQLSFAFGHPPKVIWIRRGHCSTLEIESILRDRYNDLLAFYQGEEGSFFALT